MKWLNLRTFLWWLDEVDSCEGTKYVNGYVLSWGNFARSAYSDSSQCLSVFWDKGAPFLHVWGEHLSRGFYDLSQGQMIRETFLFLPVSQSGFQFPSCHVLGEWERVWAPSHPLYSDSTPFKHEESEVSLSWRIWDNQRAGTEWS